MRMSTAYAGNQRGQFPMIESHGQVFKSYECPACGSRSSDPASAEWCQAKHKIRSLMCVPYVVKSQGCRNYLVNLDLVRKKNPKEPKPLRGINYEEMARVRQRRYMKKKKTGAI